MSNQTRTDTETFTDLLRVLPDGRPRLQEGVHPLPELLELDAEGVLEAFRTSQQADFRRVIGELEDPANPLHRMFAELRDIAARDPGNRFADLEVFAPGALATLFLELHEHVMGHPVWRHPFFLRVFAGDFDAAQLRAFALQYFNQVKNTRQCVALAIGRFHGLLEMPYGVLNERVSELAQIVLAQLVADEYGVGSHSLDDYPSLHGLFSSTTHMVMYRQLFEGLAIPFGEQDVPMIHGVADNVLIQRLVAGDGRFSVQESLASVGLGMEWGVPEFFSLLLGGMIRWAWREGVPLNRHHLWVFIAHVAYDVLHAISVMLVTSFFTTDDDSVARIKGATNLLMSGRYAMMSDLYRHVFDEPCPGPAEIGLAPAYHIADRRIEAALLEARAQAGASRVADAAGYRARTDLPFVFAAEG
ncbi:hypothetical protein [Thioalbus denitrificans]|uniref:Heme oxygenase-like protein n=1 Tax=Thioalbus denitrificans TaxID=547122 RepID=A0A369BQL0_9GAMM|nr:hypothetical protein [Thioalbus denitrificans]RCX23909.1 hypothetical protein DFQ59_11735 [Thioalbus denitrificans]